MFKVVIDKKEYTFEDKITLVDLAKKLNKQSYVALVNNRIRELNFYINFNCEVEFLDHNHFEAVKIYIKMQRLSLLNAFLVQLLAK